MAAVSSPRSVVMIRKHRVRPLTVRLLLGSACLLLLNACQDQHDNSQQATKKDPVTDERQRPADSQGTVLVHLHADEGISLEGDRVAVEDFGRKFAEISTKVKESGKSTDRVTIRVSADAEAIYKWLRFVYEEASEAGFYQLELRTPTRSYRHRFDTSHPNIETFVPPLRVHLEAGEDGSLAAIICTDLNGITRYETADQLLQHVQAYLGDERGPGSIQADSEANVSADDHLRFRNLAAVLDAVAFEDDSPDADPLVNSVWPLRSRHPRAFAEEIEEFSVEEFQELDVQEFDLHEEPARDVEMMLEIPAEEVTQPKSSLLEQLGESRESRASRRGSSQAADEAVARALVWLARHRMADGGWDFDHRQSEPEGEQTEGQGDLKGARNAATALALLAFLSSHQTHLEGTYKSTVAGGIAYLIHNQRKSDQRTSFADAGNMYSHGLATLALCEAYAMTGDKRVLEVAQLALNHIQYVQDPPGGGWRYRPKQPGDTSVSGWQVKALKSGHMSYLTVSPKTIRGVSKFLDSVARDSGAFYGYTGPGRGAATTAIGLQCRMLLGWPREHPAVERGAKWLGELGPALEEGHTNMYYNYFATQVIASIGGEPWIQWKKSLDERLIARQARVGRSAGSWYLRGDQGADRGGRLYCTSLAVLTLNTQNATQIRGVGDQDFPLE